MRLPDPKDYSSKTDYMKAVQDKIDYGYCNPRKAKEAAETERDAEQRWKERG